MHEAHHVAAVTFVPVTPMNNADVLNGIEKSRTFESYRIDARGRATTPGVAAYCLPLPPKLFQQ